MTAKPTDLSKLTTQFVTGSARYQSANPITRLVVGLVVSIASNAVLDLAPSASPAVKAQLIALYRSELAALVSSGYLSSAQQTALLGLASAI